jgi:hypothetical protein
MSPKETLQLLVKENLELQCKKMEKRLERPSPE